jgi:hypothetical protein
MKIVEERDGSKIIHDFEEMTPEKRPQDPYGHGTGLVFETLEHGGEHPDSMPQAIRVTPKAVPAFMCRSRWMARWWIARASHWSPRRPIPQRRIEEVLFERLKFHQTGQLLFHLISPLYERTSVIITTNLAFGDWPSGLPHRHSAHAAMAGDPGIITAALIENEGSPETPRWRKQS